MNHGAQIRDISLVRAFIFGGSSRFTLRSTKTGARFTYRVKASDDEKLFFVQVLTGPDNSSDYTYMGTIRGRTFRHGKKSPISIEAPSVVAFSWFWDIFVEGRMPSTVEFWHEGRCARCARPLTDPVSIEQGFGPECINHVPAMSVGNF